MSIDSFLFLIAPLILFVVGVLSLPLIFKPKTDTRRDLYKLIDDLEKKYIY